MFSKNERIRFNAIEFFLRTKGRERGYVEKSINEVTGKDGKDLLANLSDDELDKKIKELEKKLGKND